MSSRQTSLDAKLVEIPPAGRTRLSQTTAGVDRIKPLKAQLANVRMALEKLTDELLGAKAVFQAGKVDVDESFGAEKTRIESLKRRFATDVGKSNSYCARAERKVRSRVARWRRVRIPFQVSSPSLLP